MTELTEKHQEVIDGITRDLTEFCEENVIGQPTDERSLGVIEGAVKMAWQRVFDAKSCRTSARYVWACPAIEDCPDPEGIRCPYFIEEPTWRRNPIRSLRLKFFHSPGRCPEHGARLENLALVDSAVVLRTPMKAIVATVVVE